MAPIARGKKAPPTMLIIRSEDAMGGAFFRVESDRLKMVGNMMLIKNCIAMRIQMPATGAGMATMAQRIVEMKA